MKVTGIRELRARAAALLGGDEPLLVTRHGKISGVYVPLHDRDRIPDDFRREILIVLGDYLSRLLAHAGVSEDDIAEDFRDHRRSRR